MARRLRCESAPIHAKNPASLLAVPAVPWALPIRLHRGLFCQLLAARVVLVLNDCTGQGKQADRFHASVLRNIRGGKDHAVCASASDEPAARPPSSSPRVFVRADAFDIWCFLFSTTWISSSPPVHLTRCYASARGSAIAWLSPTPIRRAKLSRCRAAVRAGADFGAAPRRIGNRNCLRTAFRGVAFRVRCGVGGLPNRLAAIVCLWQRLHRQPNASGLPDSRNRGIGAALSLPCRGVSG